MKKMFILAFVTVSFSTATFGYPKVYKKEKSPAWNCLAFGMVTGTVLAAENPANWPKIFQTLKDPRLVVLVIGTSILVANKDRILQTFSTHPICAVGARPVVIPNVYFSESKSDSVEKKQEPNIPKEIEDILLEDSRGNLVNKGLTKEVNVFEDAVKTGDLTKMKRADRELRQAAAKKKISEVAEEYIQTILIRFHRNS